MGTVSPGNISVRVRTNNTASPPDTGVTVRWIVLWEMTSLQSTVARSPAKERSSVQSWTSDVSTPPSTAATLRLVTRELLFIFAEFDVS